MKRLKNWIALGLCLALVLALGPVTAAAAEEPREAAVFSDVAEDAWYAASIAAMTDRGLLIGVSDGRFSPETPVSRAMAAAALFRLAGKPDALQSPFSDAPEGCWFAPAVDWAWEAGIAAGVTPERFAPDSPCTVQEAAVFLYRYARYTGYPDAAPDFSGSSVSPWAAEAVAWAACIGLPPTDAAPTDVMTRGAFAAMLDAYCQFAEPIPDRAGAPFVIAPAEETDPPDIPDPDPDIPVVGADIPGAGADIPGAGADIPGAGADIPGAEPVDPEPLPVFPDDIPSAGGASEVTGDAVVDYANVFVGNPYAWGGNSLTQGVDAAGFVVCVYEAFGINLWGSRNCSALCTVGIPVDLGDIQAGDIVCYSGHAAIYTGGGTILEAQDESHGITNNRSVFFLPIIAIRRVI